MGRRESIIRPRSLANAGPKRPKLRPYFVRRRERNGGWLPVLEATFDDGGEGGTVYPEIPANWPAGVRVIGDWWYEARVEAVAYSGKGIRFPTLDEAGDGYDQSMCRVCVAWTNAALQAAGIIRRGRARWHVRVPVNGGVQYRTSGSECYWYSLMWVMDDGASLSSMVAFDTPYRLCLLNRINRTAVWSGLTPAAVLDISGLEGAGWHDVELEWVIGTAGKMKLTWDRVAAMEWTGDTSLLVSGITMSMVSPGGAMASDNDLTCFGGLDDVTVWRALG